MLLSTSASTNLITSHSSCFGGCHSFNDSVIELFNSWFWLRSSMFWASNKKVLCSSDTEVFKSRSSSAACAILDCSNSLMTDFSSEASCVKRSCWDLTSDLASSSAHVRSEICVFLSISWSLNARKSSWTDVILTLRASSIAFPARLQRNSARYHRKTQMSVKQKTSNHCACNERKGVRKVHGEILFPARIFKYKFCASVPP